MIERVCSRAILLTPADEVLLIQIRDPTTGWTAWITPGGGAKAGEEPEETLRRELFEETGLRDFEPGALVWLRDHPAAWEGHPTRQIESYYYLPDVPRFTPTFEHQPEAVENRAFRGFRWWSIDEIEASDEIFVPRRLGRLLRDLRRNGIPDTPIDSGE